jgi:vacuolar protein-sorting-associated protein 4
LGRAIEIIKKAIENDTAGDYEKAYQLYYQARECSSQDAMAAIVAEGLEHVY